MPSFIKNGSKSLRFLIINKSQTSNHFYSAHFVSFKQNSSSLLELSLWRPNANMLVVPGNPTKGVFTWAKNTRTWNKNGYTNAFFCEVAGEHTYSIFGNTLSTTVATGQLCIQATDKPLFVVPYITLYRTYAISHLCG